MRALTIWEPWASAIACGAKRNETRGWRTGYTGPVLICAAARPICDTGREVLDILAQWGFAVKPMLGHALCVVEISSCRLVTAALVESLHPLEAALGNYSTDSGPRYAIETISMRRVVPFPVRGQQGFFEVDDSLIRYAPIPSVDADRMGESLDEFSARAARESKADAEDRRMATR